MIKRLPDGRYQLELGEWAKIQEVHEYCVEKERAAMTKIKAPWTDEQVAALNRWQGYGFVHEFTCAAITHPEGANNVLVAERVGWFCPACDYTQGWAHDYMFKPQVNSFVIQVKTAAAAFDVLRSMPPKKDT